MDSFDFGTQVMELATGRIGEVFSFTKTKLTIDFLDVDYFDPEQVTLKKTEVKNVDDRLLESSKLRQFITGKISFEELTGGTNILPKSIESTLKPYHITISDLIQGLRIYSTKSFIEICEWVDTIVFYSEEIAFSENPWEDIRNKVTKKDILNLAAREFDEFRWTYEYNVEEANLTLEHLASEISLWVVSKGKELPSSIVRIVAEQFDCDSIDKESPATQKLYKRCLDILCAEKDPKAIQRRGYCYYCGTKIYPNDWIKARNAFLEYYQLTGDASAANTLGYIYYYGRCNKGIPEYEEAFKYFSIGHAYTYFESTYKLADMFAHGYGVVKEGDTANHLYWSVYQQTLKRFIKEDYSGKFADAALRMGNCFRYGIGARTDLETAYFYYLQADLAIRKRTEVADHYGDTVVFNGVQRALEEVRKEYAEKGRKTIFANPRWLSWTLIDHRRCKLKIRELEDGVLSLTTSPMKRRDEERAPLMLITIPKSDYCELTDKFKLRTYKNCEYSIPGGGNEILFDSYQYNWNGTTEFYLGDDLVGTITTDAYIFYAPLRKAVKPEGKLYHFVRVIFEESGRRYDYICEDASVKDGDKVVIQGYDGEKKVKVVEVFDRHENQLGLPLERYKKIIRKV